MFAFIPATRDTYMHWRGEWGLLSFMIVCSMTVGASNTTAWARFLATMMGASCSVVNWNLSRGGAVPLLFLGWIVAFCSFFVMIQWGKAPLGRTTLLAYNVSTLYAYSLSQRVDDDDDDEGGVHPIILEIATHRALAVTAGILWGLIMCRLIWPISARKKFKEGLSVLYLQMGLIWKRGPLAILLRSDCSRSYLRSGEQAALRRYASRLDALRRSAASEFELRGPFPSAACGRVLASTTRVLDAFHAMSLVTRRRGRAGGARLTDGERALLLFTAPERELLCHRICHVFQVPRLLHHARVPPSPTPYPASSAPATACSQRSSSSARSTTPPASPSPARPPTLLTIATGAVPTAVVAVARRWRSQPPPARPWPSTWPTGRWRSHRPAQRRGEGLRAAVRVRPRHGPGCRGAQGRRERD